MAVTVFINLNEDDWVEVSDAAKRGHISNITDTLIAYVLANEKPDSTLLLGHHLTPHEVLKYTLEPLSRIYMRSIRGKGIIALSPGSTFFDSLDVILPDNYIFEDEDNYVFEDGTNYELN